ncbi:MAG: MBL fold metallo-hydrolase [Pseudomonadota bacterium]
MRWFASSVLCAALVACTVSEPVQEEVGAPPPADVLYVGNAGILVAHGQTKILFDPLYQNDYGQYQLVPPELRTMLFEADGPFSEIDAILISHAHGDHFNAADLISFHAAHPDAFIIAPPQALDTLLATGAVGDGMAARFIPMGLDYGDDPLRVALQDMTVEAVRIPHAGGAQRRSIENMVYRVTLGDTATVIHMGDADPADAHFAPYENYWQAARTDAAFPPYWFFLSEAGTAILETRINAAGAIGVHVPVEAPANLVATGQDFFHSPGEVRQISVE